ncbi:MAG: phosphoribosylformylglycinamidine cyclo-ligase [Acidimicrobiia bacterium]|nr:phosphoribosylformylglycinamidine cyclo-ligase [Acidimicrobiia bacterium]
MSSYSEAGVDVAAADRFTESIAAKVTATWGENVVGRFGGFAAGLTIPAGYQDPVLMMTTDGVGTKAEIARLLGRFEGIGWDLVAMCVDDLAASVATPLGFTDYLAVGALDPVRDQALVASVADACRAAGCALLGGETAVHPGVMEPSQFDLAGAALGVVERAAMVDANRVSAGDTIVGVVSPNLRSNGFSLVRSLFSESDYQRPALGSSLGEVLLEPSVVYAPAVLDVADRVPIAGLVHVTGGGLPGNLPRALPEGLTAHIDPSRWAPAPIFGLIQDEGRLADTDMFETFNMGIGFALITGPATAEAVINLLSRHGHEALVIGTVLAGDVVAIGS